MICTDCPRACRADRDNGEIGFCGGGRYVRIAKIIDDFDYEEPCLGRVTALFFSGCSLRCSYCQNHKISRAVDAGMEYSDGGLAELFGTAERPLDLVTPTHYISAIERALALCTVAPSIIYNTSSYETIAGIDRAARFTAVFLADYKYADDRLAKRFSSAGDYRSTAMSALARMRTLVNDEWTDCNGRQILKRGLIVRHLVLPGCVQNSLDALDDIANTVGTDVVLSLMSQFTPNGIGEPSTRLRKIEYKIVAERAVKLGFRNGYFQEFDSADAKYTPEF